MKNLKLRRLRLEDEKNYLTYLDEWKNDDEVTPHSNQMRGLSYKDYLDVLEKREKGLYHPETRVPDVTYILTDGQGVIYGSLNLRLKLNDHLFKYDGHIGYGIAPSKRGQGYGRLILKSGLAICKRRGFDKVLVTCNEENIVSEKVILSQGGILENVIWKNDGYIKRYWISIK